VPHKLREKNGEINMTWKGIIKVDRDLYSRDLSNKESIKIAEKDMEYKKKDFDSIQDMIHYFEDNRELHLALQKVSKLMSKDLKFWRENLVGMKEEMADRAQHIYDKRSSE
jgi:hypothetical protein